MGRRRVAKWWAASLFLGLLLAALQLLGSVALADDSSVGAEGGTVHAIWSTDVRLDAETVQATCFGNFAEYRVDFRFVNEGAARRVMLGFPFQRGSDPEYVSPEWPVGFQAWQNGRPLAVKAVVVSGGATPEDATGGYFVHEAVFPHGATMITVSYLSDPGGYASDRGSHAGAGHGMAAFYQYWLHTGSTWKGPIGKAVVRYQFADSFDGSGIQLPARDAPVGVAVTTPTNWTRPLPRTYQWEFTNFEPQLAGAGSNWWARQSPYDITLGFANGYYKGTTDAAWTWSSVARGFGTTKYDNLQDGDLTTCWADGAPGPGTGQWIQARFKRPAHLRELRIVPGNNMYDSAFGEFARPKTLQAVFSDGSSKLLHLNDAPTLQRFPVDVTTSSVRFVIKSVYLGSDYPATCISEVELGTQRAPGYAPFGQLIDDPYATGRLAAWAGPAAPAIRSRAGTRYSSRHYAAYTGGDLIGVTRSSPVTTAPFAQPSSLAAITAKDHALRLPDARLVGKPAAVTALSNWNFDIRYSSGIELLVNTNLRRGPRTTLAAELAAEKKKVRRYEDKRSEPFELLTLGRQRVGVAPGGRAFVGTSTSASGTVSIPSQLFWSADDRSFHLYAQSPAVTTDRLVAVARSMLGLPFDSGQLLAGSTHASSGGGKSSGSLLWLAWIGFGALVAAVIGAVIAQERRRQRKVAPPPEAQ